MIHIALGIITDVLRPILTDACLSLPGTPAIPMRIVTTDEVTDGRDAAALLRIACNDGMTLHYPHESDAENTQTVLFTVSYRRADLPALVSATAQEMQAAVFTGARAVMRAILRGFESVGGQVIRDGIVVRTPHELTMNDADVDVEATTASCTVSAVFPISDYSVLIPS